MCFPLVAVRQSSLQAVKKSNTIYKCEKIFKIFILLKESSAESVGFGKQHRAEGNSRRADANKDKKQKMTNSSNTSRK